MSSVANLLALHEAKYGPREGAASTGGSAFAPILDMLKQKSEEKRRQENVKTQMSNFQQMMETMNSMPDNSTTARGVGILDDEKNKNRKGITGISTMIPQKEMSIDENGAVNIKLGMRATTPQEQKAQFEIQKSQMEQEKANAKAQLLDGYIRGDIQEGAILKEMGSLSITPEEFDMASQARERMRSVSSNNPNTIPGGFEATEMQRDKFGNMIPSGIKKIQQPTEEDNLRKQSLALDVQAKQEEPFRFNKTAEIAQEKFNMDKQKFQNEVQDRAETREIKSTSAIDAAQASVDAIDHLIKNKNYFGAIEGRMPAGLNQGKREWAKNYDFLEAKNMLNVISEMKNQSRTGATGFGQLNREELRVLQNASMKLDKQLDEKTAEKYLNEMKNAFTKIIDREQNGYEIERGGQVGQADNNDPLGIR